MLTNVLEALCNDDQRSAALAHATDSDLVIAAVIGARAHDEHREPDRWAPSKRLAAYIRAAGSPATVSAILRVSFKSEYPWHVATQLFLDSGTPFENGKYHTGEEVLAWLSTQPYGATVINECTLWELTRKMARWDLQRDYNRAAAAIPYVTDAATLREAASSVSTKVCSAALMRIAEFVDADELVALLDTTFSSDVSWKHSCRSLPIEAVREFAYRSDFSFIRREFALSLLDTDEIVAELRSGRHQQNVIDSMHTVLDKRAAVAV